MPLSQLRVAVVGAGPAGLTLGLLLYKRGIPFTIFELRGKPTEEDLAKPAGSLDLHEESGLAAIKECGLFDEFMTLTGDCTEAQRISNKHGKILYAEEGESNNRPEISRNKIVKLLLSHLPASNIRWNHKLLCATSRPASGHGETELDFGEKGKQTFDLVVGADGAWSKIRNMLTDVKPQYAGMDLVTLDVRHITTRYPHLAEFIGSGTMMALGNRHGICSQRSVQDSARIYIFISTDGKDFISTSGIEGKTVMQAKILLLESDSLFKDWGHNLKELVSVACDDEWAVEPWSCIDIKPLHTLPIGHAWKHRAGATLIGDAAHLMNPPAGEGVNIAMLDAFFLSQAIVKAHQANTNDTAALQNALDPMIEAFEVDMAARAKEMADGTLEVSGMMFDGEDGATVMADWFKSFRLQPE